jgi:DNA-3-methyladenine glycosylase I
VVGDDGIARCGWAGRDAEYLRYHDEEWGTPLHGDRALFEKLCLEGFQSGLSWITILKRRPAFRELFLGFDIDLVARFGESDVERLMGDTRIIRNRAKIEATVSNARAARDLVDGHPGALDTLMWGYAPEPRTVAPEDYRDVAAFTAESSALSAELKGLGFRFVGPTTVYALMQSAGMVDDHERGCWRSSAQTAGAVGGT